MYLCVIIHEKKENTMKRSFVEFFNSNKNRQPILQAAFDSAVSETGIVAEITPDGRVNFDDLSKRDAFYKAVSDHLVGTPLEGTEVVASTQYSGGLITKIKNAAASAIHRAAAPARPTSG